MSSARGSPRHWILTSYWSLQKYGTTTVAGASCPSIAGTMTRAWSATLLQCSTRTWYPTALRHDLTSPSAHTLGALVRPAATQMTPLSTCTPLPPSHPVAGCEPIPTTTRSASSSVPSESTTCSTCPPAPRTSATPTPVRTSTPSARCSLATSDPVCSPSTDANGAGCGSTRTTCTPSPRRLAATSQPMKPAPTTTARRAEPACLRSARLSSNDRRTRIPSRSPNDGMRLGVNPVAMTSSSYSTTLPSASVTVCAAVSSAP